MGTSTFFYASFLRPSASFLAVDVSYSRPAGAEGFWHAVRLGGGLRSGVPTSATHLPLEGFLNAQLTVRMGVWEPSAGPEVGLSGFARLTPRTVLPAKELNEKEDERLGPVYLALNASPLRFRFGVVTVSALELQIGTSAPPLGNVTRIYLGALRVGILL